MADSNGDHDDNGLNGEHLADKGPEMRVVVGTVVHATRDEPMVVMEKKALGVRGSRIVFLEDAANLEKLQQEFGFPSSAIVVLTDRQFVMPGLVDTHIHASQFPNNGLCLDLPLLKWLEQYTFPLEAAYADTAFAARVYARVVDRTLRNGTTTASYFATLHAASTRVLADAAVARGQRALVGKVNMVENCPDYYREASVEESLRETEDLLTYVENLKSPLVQGIVTPRFAITSPGQQLAALGEVARRRGCHVQTHLSESQSEVAFAAKLFPDAASYCDVYRRAGLLSRKTILAHCVWLSDAELDMVAECGAGVAHCPCSNLNLCSGHCDVRRLLDRGIKVALGTDCSGGHSASILDAMRTCLHVSRSLLLAQPDYRNLTLSEAFRLATLGGAQVVDMEDQIGNFVVGKQFDALIIDVEAPDSPLDIFDRDNIKDIIEKFLYNGDDRNIVQVFVAGHCVSQRPHVKLHTNST